MCRYSHSDEQRQFIERESCLGSLKAAKYAIRLRLFQVLLGQKIFLNALVAANRAMYACLGDRLVDTSIVDQFISSYELKLKTKYGSVGIGLVLSDAASR
jgi:hypothetical protein